MIEAPHFASIWTIFSQISSIRNKSISETILQSLCIFEVFPTSWSTFPLKAWPILESYGFCLFENGNNKNYDSGFRSQLWVLKQTWTIENAHTLMAELDLDNEKRNQCNCSMFDPKLNYKSTLTPSCPAIYISSALQMQPISYRTTRFFTCRCTCSVSDRWRSLHSCPILCHLSKRAPTISIISYPCSVLWQRYKKRLMRLGTVSFLLINIGQCSLMAYLHYVLVCFCSFTCSMVSGRKSCLWRIIEAWASHCPVFLLDSKLDHLTSNTESLVLWWTEQRYLFENNRPKDKSQRKTIVTQFCMILPVSRDVQVIVWQVPTFVGVTHHVPGYTPSRDWSPASS